MKYLLFTFFLLVMAPFSMAQQTVERIYVIPGIGTDGRLFEHFHPGIEVVVLEHFDPIKGEDMTAYAQRLACEVDTTKPFALLGCSIGGMLSVEMSKVIHPEKTFLVASAANANELPMRYRSMRYLPANKLFGGKSLQKMTPLGWYFFEHSRRKDNALFKEMINDKSTTWLKWAVQAVVDWKFDEEVPNLVKIHGSKDRTIPMRNIDNPICIDGATHTMMYFHGEEISQIVKTHLELF